MWPLMRDADVGASPGPGSAARAPPAGARTLRRYRRCHRQETSQPRRRRRRRRPQTAWRTASATGPADPVVGGGGSAGTAGPAVAEQPGGPTRATSPAVGALCTGSAGATVADQPAGIPSVGPGAGSTVSPVTDQRTAGSGQDGRVDRVEQRRHGGGLGGRIGAPPGGQRLHEPTMKRRRLGARRLIGPAVRAEQRSDCRRDLIGTGGQQARRVGRRSRVGPSDRRAEIG